MHEACPIHVAWFCPERANHFPVVIYLFVERARALFESIRLPNPPPGEFSFGNRHQTASRSYGFVFAHCESAATPGSSFPSIHSRKAPPAVDTYVKS